MLNHARTLLMNVPGQAGFAGVLGEEIVPEDYRAVTLPDSLLAVRRLLFGAKPDRYMLNYRCRQLLALVHSCELEQFVLDLDPRVTYGFDDAPYFDRSIFASAAIPQAVPSEAITDGHILGDDEPPDRHGQMQKVWDVEILTTTTANVYSRNLASAVAATYSISSGMSSPVTLTGSGLSLRFRSSSFVDGSGPKFRVESLSRPATDLGQFLASALIMGDDVLADVFGIGTAFGAAEPMKTFYNCFNDHYDLAHRLGGLVMALVYQTNQRLTP